MKSGDLTDISFNFHDMVGFKLLTGDSEAVQFFSAEYQLHQVDSISEGLPQVILNFHRLDKKLPPGLIWHRHKVLAKWSYFIKISPEKVMIDAYGNSLSVPMIHHMLVHPSLRYLASYQNIIMLHAGAVAYQGRSLVLTGKGGVGKTSITSLLLARGGPEWAAHADDYVFLTPQGESLAYLTRAHLYRNLLRPVPEIWHTLTFKEKINLEILGWIRELSREQIKWPVRVPLTRLWPGHRVIMRAVPAGLVVLQRNSGELPILRKADSRKGLRDELLKVNFFEARHYLDLTRQCMPEDEWQAFDMGWRQRESQILERCIEKIPVYELLIPAGAKIRENSILFDALARLAKPE
jgi:hypothetical protein